MAERSGIQTLSAWRKREAREVGEHQESEVSLESSEESEWPNVSAGRSG